jgi:hypothetical protein
MCELEAQAATLAQRDRRHLIYEQLAEQADVDLDPREMWVLYRVAQARPGAVQEFALEEPLRTLVADGLVDEADVPQVTAAGRAVLDRLRAARQTRIEALLADWSPERHPEILQIVDRLTSSLAERPPEPVTVA